MNFEEYLASKKIDSVKFKKDDSALWHEFENHFEQMHPKSFTAQKLYLINNLRRKYTLTPQDDEIAKGSTKSSTPVIPKRKVQIKK
ncbi:hypothetical protein [Aureibacter tunicatorum]|uniref:Uncharacterized protein n=1 Tax=Aureibacter tunicatorum TaxID=866807 RepID=A0AAE4BR94_9BACT|nr:hypothetical protein [Aureibacter tunicatorum]MDR6237718.1 hypothetical protein [Aureibacter tunicatorum]BDD02753.1 hypothetical protein AUTU_02360 [Aureibacter tunicatorum]